MHSQLGKQIALCAMSYFVAGKLSLLLAIPPGYATPIWPSAGIALALVYLNGYKIWPGVLLGSFAVNVTWQEPLHWGALIANLQLPLMIAIGAALQAVFSSFLIRRYIAAPLQLDTLRSVTRFILIVCGIGCMVSPSVGIAALLWSGALSPENYYFNWFTWWVGDGLGVLIFSTAVFVYYAKPRELWGSRQKIIPPIFFIATLVLVVLYVLFSRWEVEREQLVFGQRGKQLFTQFQEGVNSDLTALYAVKSFFDAQEVVERSQFEQFVGGILARTPGFQAIAWNEKIDHIRRDDLEAEMTADFGRPLRVFRRSVLGRQQPDIEREEYAVIRFVSPLESNSAALGYSLGSAVHPADALARARALRGAAVTKPITLVQERHGELGVVAYLPVYSRGEAEQLRGYISGVFRISDLIRDLLQLDIVEGFAVGVTAHIGDKSYDLFRRPSRGVILGEGNFNASWDVVFADQVWQISVSASDLSLADNHSLTPWGGLAIGMVFTGLLGMALLVLTGQRYRADKLSHERQEMLDRLHSTQAQLVEVEKMASLGGMVAGFAHELNTPIGIAITAESTLQSDLQMLAEQLEGGADQQTMQKVLRRLDEISQITLANIQRAAELIKRFKQVSVDQSNAEARTINLRDYLNETLVYVAPRFQDGGFELELDCAADIQLSTVPGGLAQVVINLLDNCVEHGFVDRGKGRAKVCVSAEDDGVRISISDDGVGIAAAAVKKVFDPFYTTRRGKDGRGTGLGLHLVYNIVHQQLQGRISVESNAGGTRFDIILPYDVDSREAVADQSLS